MNFPPVNMPYNTLKLIEGEGVYGFLDDVADYLKDSLRKSGIVISKPSFKPLSYTFFQVVPNYYLSFPKFFTNDIVN